MCSGGFCVRAVFVFGPLSREGIVFARADPFRVFGRFLWAQILFARAGRFYVFGPLLHVQIAFARAGGGFQPTSRLPIW